MSNRFVLIFSLIVVFFLGFLVFNSNDAGAPTDSEAQLTSHTVGAGTANVTLIEYGDFECPACLRFYPVMEQVKQKYGDQITFQFRHYPLIEIHQNALIASRAAEAAGLQGKFWEMYDLLYRNQQQWTLGGNPSSAFEDYAGQLELDIEKFKADLASNETNQAVNADRNEAKRLGYNSTPTFVLNGEQLTDATDSLEYFSRVIDAAIAENQGDEQSDEPASNSNDEPAAKPEESTE